MNLIYSTLLLVLSTGCLHTDTKSDKTERPAVKPTATNNTSQHIEGSSTLRGEKRAGPGTYFLYGAEHLNLKNPYFDIPVVYNRDVRRWMDFFLNRGKDYFVRYSERAGRYAPLMGKILSELGMPRDLIFLAMAESGFNNKAKSWARAVGPWQFMPLTGKRYGLNIDWYIDERRDPIKATIAAATYLRDLYQRFGSWELAAAGYNAGEGKVGRAIKRYKTENFWKIKKGRYLKRETKNYVPKIMALAIIGKNLESFGLEDIDFHEPLDFEEIKVGPGTDLVVLSEKLGLPFEEVQRLNPEVLRWFTPPGRDYMLRVPPGTQAVFQKCCRSEDLLAKSFQIHKVKRPSTLAAVARVYRIRDVGVLRWLNPGLSLKRKLPKGTEVQIPFRLGQGRRDAMYADLYDRRRRGRRSGRNRYRRYLHLAKTRGKLIQNPSGFYVVQKGDSLWSVAKKTGQSIYTIIRSNMRILNRRQIAPGDRLAVR